MRYLRYGLLATMLVSVFLSTCALASDRLNEAPNRAMVIANLDSVKPIPYEEWPETSVMLGEFVRITVSGIQGVTNEYEGPANAVFDIIVSSAAYLADAEQIILILELSEDGSATAVRNWTTVRKIWCFNNEADFEHFADDMLAFALEEVGKHCAILPAAQSDH